MIIRVLVVDDEPLARVGITTRLSAYSDTLVVGDPRVPAIAMRIEDILKNYPMTYDSLTAALAKRYSDFGVNAKYHTLRRALEAERKFCFPHPLNPTKPKGAVQRLYNSNIFQESDKHYMRRT